MSPDKTLEDNAKSIAARLDMALTDKFLRAREKVAEARDAREDIISRRDVLIAEGNRGDDRDLMTISVELQKADNAIVDAVAKLSAARDELAPTYAASVKAELKKFAPDLAQAVETVERLRWIFWHLVRHAHRNGLPQYGFLMPLQSTAYLAQLVDRLSK